MASRIDVWFRVAVSFAFVCALTAGCQREQAGTKKQARLLAAENVELKEQVAAQETRIADLRKQHAEALRQQAKLLTQYKSRNDALQKDIEQGIAERVESVTAALVNESARLRQESETLKTENERLKAENERLEAEIERLKSQQAAGAQEGP